MIEIVPAVNAVTFEEVVQKIRRAEPYATWIHLDVADGSFTENILWHDAYDLQNFETPLFIELHLMVSPIEKKIHDWFLPNVRRVIFHAEATQDIEGTIQTCHQSNVQAGVAIYPGTSHDILLPYIKKADLLQTLGVIPGKSRQVFRADTLQKITALRAACPSCVIEVDGGVTAENTKKIIEAGATVLVAGSAVYDIGSVAENIQNLRRHAEA